MITITAKDRIFVLLAAPLAVLACYYFFLRSPCMRQAKELEASLAETDEPAILMQQGNLLRDRLAKVDAALAQVQPKEETASPAVSASEPSARLQQIVNVLQDQSVRVVQSEWIEPEENAIVEPDAAVLALQKAGVLDHPDCWNLELESSYASFVKALSAFRTNGLPVVPLSVSMDAHGRANACRWKVKLWL